MPTLFTRIIDGDIPGTFVWRDDEVVAFLSINPLSDGHTLVVPRQEIDHWVDCPDALRDRLFAVAQTIARAIEQAWRPTKVALMAVGLEVPHLHLHVVPIWEMADIDFSRAGTASREELEEAAGKIRAHLRADHAGNAPAFE